MGILLAPSFRPNRSSVRGQNRWQQARKSSFDFVASQVVYDSHSGLRRAHQAGRAKHRVVVILHLAAELGPKGVRVTGVAPGAIETDMSTWLGSDEGKAQAHSIQALQRIGQAEDIARVVAFLAGPDGDWVTGHIVNASGGTKL